MSNPGARLRMATRLRIERLEDRRLLVAGDLDPSFGGGDGLVTTDFSQRVDHLNDMALQADGKIVAVGSSFKPSNKPSYYDQNQDMALARYNPDGTLDSSFDGDGRVITGFSSGKNDSLTSVTIQPDGKILGVGPSGGGDFAVVRYNSNGTLDNSFDRDGKLTTNLGGDDVPWAVELDPAGGGKFVVGGVSNGKIVLTRYLADGRLDTSFDGDGKVITTITAQWGGSMAVNASGIYVSYNADDVGRVAKFLPSGSLDTTFGASGIATGPAGSNLLSLLLQNDGKIVLAGHSTLADEPGMVVRFNTNGSMDTSFDSDGATIYLPHTTFYGTVLQPDGKIIALGYQWNHSPWLAVAVRFNIDGSVDTTYGASGKASANFGVKSVMFAGVLQSDGSLVVGGDVRGSFFNDGSAENWALARFLGDPPVAASSTEPISATETDAALMLLLMEDTTSTTRRK